MSGFTIMARAILAAILLPNLLAAAERADLAPGGTLRITGSHGDLNIRAWDGREVELVVDHPAAARLERKSDTELAIVTTLPPRTWKRMWRRKWDILEYQIHVPRDTRLDVEHFTGTVAVMDLASDMKIHVHFGDIVLLMPCAENYAIDARTKLGPIDSDFPAGAASGRKLFLRVGAGGITIKSANPKETRVPPAPLSQAGFASAPRS